MRVLIELLDRIIEGTVIDGKPLEDGSEAFDLESTFIVRCDDGVSFKIHGWMVDVRVLDYPAVGNVEHG